MQALTCHLASPIKVLGNVRQFFPRHGSPRRFQLSDYPGESLRKSVVNVSGDTIALLSDRGLTALSREAR